MYKESYRFRRLTDGQTGSVLIFSKTDEQGTSDHFLIALDTDISCALDNFDEMEHRPFQTEIAIDEQIADVLMTHRNELEVVKTKLRPGEYHPRIWRQKSSFDICTVNVNRSMKLGSRYEREFIAMIQAVSNLFVQGAEVFRYVEPSPDTDRAFGHRIREVLILACTEVEAAWKSVLAFNRRLSHDRPNTKDYVALLPIMRLNEWEIRLTNYPSYPTFKPFGAWSPNKPTQTLPWYDAYNSVKHDREMKFSDARFDYMIQALGACFVMILAQFGIPAAYAHDMHYPSLFSIVEEPNWPLSEQYVKPFSIERKGNWIAGSWIEVSV